MNELRTYQSESDPEVRMTKKVLKEIKVTTYSNNVHLPFLTYFVWSNSSWVTF